MSSRAATTPRPGHAGCATRVSRDPPQLNGGPAADQPRSRRVRSGRWRSRADIASRGVHHRQGRSAPMANGDYPLTFSVDYPDRPLNRVSTGLRIFAAIPILILAATIGGGFARFGGFGFALGGAGLLF